MLYQYILSIYKWRWAHINAFNLFSCALENRTSILVQAVLVNRLDLSRSYIVYIIVRNMNDIISFQILPIAFFILTSKRLNYKSLIPESFLFYRYYQLDIKIWLIINNKELRTTKSMLQACCEKAINFMSLHMNTLIIKCVCIQMTICFTTTEA